MTAQWSPPRNNIPLCGCPIPWAQSEEYKVRLRGYDPDEFVLAGGPADELEWSLSGSLADIVEYKYRMDLAPLHP